MISIQCLKTELYVRCGEVTGCVFGDTCVPFSCHACRGQCCAMSVRPDSSEGQQETEMPKAQLLLPVRARKRYCFPPGWEFISRENLKVKLWLAP